MREIRLAMLTRVRDWCERKMSDHYAASRRCPHCLRWTHTVGGAAECVDLEPNVSRMRCNWCQRTSDWQIVGPIAIPRPASTKEDR
jgi:hypothetical protein